MARVDAFAHLDSRVVAQTPVELIMAHVNGYNCARVVLQQAVSESTGRRPNIETDQSSDIDLEIAQCRLQFHSAAADVTRGRIACALQPNVRIDRKSLGGFVYKLLVNQDDAGHHQSLRLRARWRQPAIDQQLVDALALHARHCIRSPTVREGIRCGSQPSLTVGLLTLTVARLAAPREENR